MSALFLGSDDLQGVTHGWAGALNAASALFRGHAIALSTNGLERLAAEGPAILVHTADDYASLARFAELAARVRPGAMVACHPYGPYRFEHPRADRIVTDQRSRDDVDVAACHRSGAAVSRARP